MNKTKKRALELLHTGYTPRNSQRRIFPKWRQAYAIAKSEEHKYAQYCAARLLGAASALSFAVWKEGWRNDFTSAT